MTNLSNKTDSAPEILGNLIRRAERAGASDIHVQMRGQKAEIAKGPK